MLKAASALSALLLTACASPVYGPGILVLPGSNKTFDQFRFDEQECRGYAQAQLTDSGSEWGSTQQRYDRAFLQCMYAKGHKVPVSGRYFDAEPQAAVPTPPPPPQGKPPPPQAQPPTPPPPPAQPPTPPPSPQG
jgi:hypothetical protein